jgi:hypothetical protein
MATAAVVKSRARLLIGLGALLLASACEQTGPYSEYPRGGHAQRGADEAPIMMQTDRSTYVGAVPVNFRLTNRTGRRIEYNLCRAQLQRDEEGSWRQAQSPLADACTMELRGLAPGQSTSFSFRPTPGLRAGRYRVMTAISDPRERWGIEVVSNTFTLARDPARD